MQESFNPINYTFEWTDNWYKFYRESAHRKALAARNARYRELKEQGFQVRRFTIRNQLMTKGGIGTNHPQISLIVNVYYVEWEDK